MGCKARKTNKLLVYNNIKLPLCTETSARVRDLSLSPRCSWGFRSSGMLRGLGLYEVVSHCRENLSFLSWRVKQSQLTNYKYTVKSTSLSTPVEWRLLLYVLPTRRTFQELDLFQVRAIRCLLINKLIIKTHTHGTGHVSKKKKSQSIDKIHEKCNRSNYRKRFYLLHSALTRSESRFSDS
jgi:hypothetical protein